MHACGWQSYAFFADQYYILLLLVVCDIAVQKPGAHIITTRGAAQA
jgi:hypothetical protein